MVDSKDWLDEEYEKLTGELKHFCPEWDFLPIDETCPEFEACLCFREGK